MTKQEIINKTEYSEAELINLALAYALHDVREARNEQTDCEGWDHFEDLRAALQAIYDERMTTI